MAHGLGAAQSHRILTGGLILPPPLWYSKIVVSPSRADEIRALLAPAVNWYLEIESKIDFGQAYDSEWDDSAIKTLKALQACSALSPRQRNLTNDILSSFRAYLQEDYDYNHLYDAKTPLLDLADSVGFDFIAAEKPYRVALAEQVARERGLSS
jgi:hypothetical protein